MRTVYCPWCGEAYAMVEGDGPTREERYGITPPCCFMVRFKLLSDNPGLSEEELSERIVEFKRASK